jgi:pimeloyl-ACP methyl ester carboxylesterase
MSVSEALGEQREVELPQGTIRYRERGDGEPIVFVHGLLVNGDLWRKVVPLLADRYRCITPDWPLGSHAVPLDPGADLTPTGLARLIADFMKALDLSGVTLVGNDTGTALSQITATEHPERIGRLVLTTGDAFDNFPPAAFRPLVALGYVPQLLGPIEKALRPNAVRRLSFKYLADSLTDPAILDSYAGSLRHAGIRRDVAKALRDARPRYTRAAAEKLPHLEAPALIVWATKDRFFPNDHAYKLAELIPDARVVEVRDSYAFVSEDQPERTAEAIAEFMAARPATTAAAGPAGGRPAGG